MKATRDNTYVGTTKCTACGAKLDVERGDLRIDTRGGFFGTTQVPYIECPLCHMRLIVNDNQLHKFGLCRSDN